MAVKVSRQQSTAVASISLAAHRERAYFLLMCPLNLNIQFQYTSPSPLLWFFSFLALCYWIYFSFGLLLKSSVSTHLTHQESGWLSLHLNPILNANECFVKKKKKSPSVKPSFFIFPVCFSLLCSGDAPLFFGLEEIKESPSFMSGLTLRERQKGNAGHQEQSAVTFEASFWYSPTLCLSPRFLSSCRPSSIPLSVSVPAHSPATFLRSHFTLFLLASGKAIKA